jgi:hypothetical protein
MVGWLDLMARAAPESDPCSMTAAKLRQRDQSGSLFMIEYQISKFGQSL